MGKIVLTGVDSSQTAIKNVHGFARMMGSVARKLVTEATCDLYVVNTTQN